MDEKQLDADEGVTGEVGSEGGSPGETVVRRSRDAARPRGSEATETEDPSGKAVEAVERVGESGQPVKRSP